MQIKSHLPFIFKKNTKVQVIKCLLNLGKIILLIIDPKIGKDHESQAEQHSVIFDHQLLMIKITL